MGKFEAGNKMGKGRPKGSKNKKTVERKERLEKLFDENGGYEEIFRDISDIEDPAQRVNARIKLLEYFNPKLKAVDMTTTIEDTREDLTQQEIEQRLKDMQEELKQFDDD